jgi:hypothetical protein
LLALVLTSQFEVSTLVPLNSSSNECGVCVGVGVGSGVEVGVAFGSCPPGSAEREGGALKNGVGVGVAGSVWAVGPSPQHDGCGRECTRLRACGLAAGGAQAASGSMATTAQMSLPTGLGIGDVSW